ncbi:hypothetical protein A2U01_0025107 [Trifolium medium]|uniref:Uncharacterized protein n=1 Tax=Trifolium medium TaxID=97028 RepID=A0A392NZV1_9FABA|nr:hypothetical protein [Trifolium medium]
MIKDRLTGVHYNNLQQHSCSGVVAKRPTFSLQRDSTTTTQLLLLSPYQTFLVASIIMFMASTTYPESLSPIKPHMQPQICKNKNL